MLSSIVISLSEQRRMEYYMGFDVCVRIQRR